MENVNCKPAADNSKPIGFPVFFVNLSPNEDPDYNKIEDSGFDLRAWITEEEGTNQYSKEPKIVLKPLERKLIHTGLYFELPPGYEMQIRARSGMALKRGLGVLNSPATIDSNYRGEIGIIAVNLSNDDIVIENAERIAQGVICPVLNKCKGVELIKVDKLHNTERGEQGFGDSGDK